MAKMVKIGELGGVIQEFALADGETVSQLAEMADIDTAGKTYRANGVTVQGTYVPSDGEVVLLVKESKGFC